jgi:protein-L-isoaspartate(D-aspartate) O-methyltransferase
MRRELVFFAVWLVATVVLVVPTGCSEGDKDMAARRNNMVERQIAARGVRDPRVLDALRSVERHLFVPDDVLDRAYDDSPLFIGHGQTISQPYIVALMTEVLETTPDSRVLEVGTGSGYQAAVLSGLVAEVYTIEIVEALGVAARERLARLGYDNVHVRVGDGYRGWPEEAPFDRIIVTAAPPEIPPALVEQLADPGRLVLPVGTTYQELVLVEKRDGKVSRRTVTGVRFVPMVHGDREEEDGEDAERGPR